MVSNPPDLLAKCSGVRASSLSRACTAVVHAEKELAIHMCIRISKPQPYPHRRPVHFRPRRERRESCLEGSKHRRLLATFVALHDSELSFTWERPKIPTTAQHATINTQNTRPDHHVPDQTKQQQKMEVLR